MRIKINQIDFDVTPVGAQMRAALLSDPVIGQAILRNVWEWDAAAGSGRPLTPLLNNRAAVLPNGLSFFVAKAGPDGRIVKNEAPSAAMATRFLKVTGAKDLKELMGALNRIVELPQKILPLDVFAPLNATASYRLKMFTDFAVVQLQNAGRNLTAYLFLPAQVGFHAELGAIPDQAAHDAAGVDMNKLRPGFIVPARAPAAQAMRRAALARQFEELQAEMQALGGPEKATDLHRLRAARLAAEWKVIAPKQKAN